MAVSKEDKRLVYEVLGKMALEELREVRKRTQELITRRRIQRARKNRE
jgi:hypothetical protein